MHHLPFSLQQARQRSTVFGLSKKSVLNSVFLLPCLKTKNL